MPTLPKYERKEIPGVVSLPRADPRAMTEVNRAQGEFGRATANLGFALTDVGIKVQQKIQQAEEVSQLSNALTTYDTKLNEWALEYGNKKETDPAKAKEEYDKNEKAISESAGGLITQPRAYDSYIRAIKEGRVARDKLFYSTINKNRIAKVEKETENALTVIETRLIENGISDITAYKDRIHDAVKTNVYSKEVAEGLTLAAEARIKKGIEQKEKNLAITASLVDLKTRYMETPGYKSEYGEGITGAINEVESAKYLKENGEDKQRVVLSSLIQQQARRDREYKDYSDKKVGTASVKIYNKETLSSGDIEGLEPPELALIEKIKDYQTRQDRADVRFNESEKRAIESEKRAGRVEKRNQRYEEKIATQDRSSEIAGEIRAKILSNQAIDITNDIYKKVGDGKDQGLLIQDANQLNSMLSKVQKDPKYKLGTDVINMALKFDPVKKGQMLLDFYEKVNAEQATGKRIIDIANEMVNPVKESQIKKWILGLYDSWTGDKVPEKTVTIDGKQYKDGDIVTKDGKSFRVKVK